jgi:hypothetical protein
MTRDEAIAILRKEYLCVDRDCGIEKNCGKCDLVMPSKEPILEAFKMAIKALEQEPCEDAPGTNARDMIDRQAAIDAVQHAFDRETLLNRFVRKVAVDALKTMPSAQPELAIPLQWIEAQIEWLKSLGNGFSTLAAGQISAMVDKWKEEQDG